MARYISFFLILVLTTACSQNGFQTVVIEPLAESNEQASQETPPEIEPEIPPEPSLPPLPEPFLGGICSKLNFSDVIWPMALSSSEQKALALGLNITGSFEGRANWGNITNNFDGQGISLGLLQQNLGQGSLQPLLIKMFEGNYKALQTFFTSSDLLSMQNMLNTWNSGELGLAAIKPPALFSSESALSPLDIGFESESQQKALAPLLTEKNTASVNWAVSTLYQSDGKTFIPRWKTSLSNMAVSAPYRSLQLEASLKVFDKAVGYFEYFKFTELRMLLMMFDYVTQNGGFNSTHKSEFESYAAANPNDTETQKALKLLEIRLKSVRPEYVEDVRSRKTTLINGTGRVHGSNRILETEYCYKGSDRIR